MPATVTITDATRKISDKPGFDTADFTFRLDAPFTLRPGIGVRPNTNLPPYHPKFGAYRVRVGGDSRSTGLDAGGRGVVCGLTRCGAPDAQLLRLDPGTEVGLEAVTFPETGLTTDGSVTVYVWALHDAYGWV